MPPDAAARRSVWAVPAFALTFIPLVAFLPSAERAALAPRIGVGLITGAIGIPLLVRLVAQRDRAAIAAAGLLGWGVLSALASGSWLTWSGEFAFGTGALFLLTLGGYWAIGRTLPAEAVRYLVAGFVAGAVLNALVAMAQGPWDLSPYSIALALYDNRSTGLFANPLFLGATVAAAVALLPVLGRRRPWLAVSALFVLAGGAQMSGGRITVALTVVAALWAVARRRGLVGAALFAALVLGLAAGALLPQHRDATGAQRLTDPGNGLHSRELAWRSGLRAAAERPLLGFGPGRFATGTTPHLSLDQARIDGPDRAYQDAHNIFVQYASTTGFVGLALLVAWLVLATRQARPRFQPEVLAAATVLLASHLLEPQNVALTPLMFMLLGASAARVQAPTRSAAERWTAWVPAAVAGVLAAAVLVGDVRLRTADLDGDLGAARTAAHLLRPWAEPLHAQTIIYVYRGTIKLEGGHTAAQSDDLAQAAQTARAATRREPDSWLLQVELAGVLRRLGDRVGAAAAFRDALRRNPWSHYALAGRAGELDETHDVKAAAACRTLDGLLRSKAEAPTDVPGLQRDCFG